MPNVGIGTTSPGSRLHIRSAGSSNLRIDSTSTTSGASLTLYNDVFEGFNIYNNPTSATNTNLLSIPRSSAIMGAGSSGLSLVAVGNAPIRFGTNGSAFGNERMRIDASGNVGIGTTGPTAKVDISDSSYADLSISTDDSQIYAWASGSTEIIMSGGTGPSSLLMGTTSTLVTAGTTLADLRAQASFNSGPMLNSSSVQFVAEAAPTAAGAAGRIEFSTSNGTNLLERMRIDSSGNVGVGTASPGEKLAVSGAISIGNAAGTGDGTIRWTGTDFEGRKAGAWVSLTGTGGGGETNTASNLGAGGVGVFVIKSGVDLRFKNINTASTRLTVTNDTTNNEIDLDVSEANLNLANMGGTLPVSKGGTGSTASLNNNRLMVSSGGNIIEAAAITANRALASNASGIPVASAVTDTELGYLSGVTSAIQTQLSAKQAALGYTPVNRAGDMMVGSLTLPTNGLVVGTNQLVVSSGNVGIGTAVPGAKLDVVGQINATGMRVSGQATSQQTVVSSGATVDFNNGNVQVLQSIGGSAITLNNMQDGGAYTLIVTDTTARTYTFTNCTNSRFQPTNGPTTASKHTIYSILKVTVASATWCYINWSSDY